VPAERQSSTPMPGACHDLPFNPPMPESASIRPSSLGRDMEGTLNDVSAPMRRRLDICPLTAEAVDRLVARVNENVRR